MKIEIRGDLLRPYVEACAEIAPGNCKRPLLEAMRIEAGPGGTTFHATNLAETVWLTSDGFVATEPGSVCVPSAALLRIVREAGSNPLTITDAPNSRAVVCWGAAQARLPTEVPEHMPAIDRFDPAAGSFQISASTLIAAFQRTSFATQREFVARVLHGVNVVVRGSALAFAATDGRHFTLVETECENPQSVTWSIIVPPVPLRQLRRIAPADDDRVEVQAAPAWLRVRGPRGELAWRLLTGNYPHWEGHVPRAASREIPVERLALLKLLRSHGVVKSAVKNYLFELTSGMLTFHAQATIEGDTTARLELPWTFDPFTISLDPSLMEPALAAMTSESVVLGFDSPTQPAIIREHTDAFTYIYSICPRHM